VTTSWYLVVSSGPEAGSGYQLMGPSITIGRAADNDIVLDDNMVSRHHARLKMQGDTYTLTDLGSANGTLVNGRRVSAPVALQANDSVRFGTKSGFVFSAQPILSGDETFVAQGLVPEHAQVPSAAPVPPQPAAGGSLVCAGCGYANRPGVRFCESCGGALAVVQEPVCPACGACNRPGVRFCESCGETLVGERPMPSRRRSPVLSQALSFLTSIVGTVLVACLSALVTRFALPFVMSSVLAPAQQPMFTSEEAARVASLYVAGEYPDFLAAQPTVQPALDGEREVFAVGYTRGGAATPDDPLTTLVVLVDAETGQAEVLTPGASR
jgi:hypothetical protein